MLSERAQNLLKILVERYIADGQPVGSRALSRFSLAGAVARHHPQRDGRPGGDGLRREPAHLRRAHAHAQGLSLLRRYAAHRAARWRTSSASSSRSSSLPDDPHRVVATASQILSDLTHFAGIVVSPRRRGAVLRHVEFFGLSDKRVLLIIVASDGDVQNRVLVTDRTYSPSQLRRRPTTSTRTTRAGVRPAAPARARRAAPTCTATSPRSCRPAIRSRQRDAAPPREGVVISGGRNLLEVRRPLRRHAAPAPALRPLRAEDAAPRHPRA